VTVLNLPGYTPPPRYDEQPWTQARLEESATEGGTYATTELFELDPVDSDPIYPDTRNFTTTLGTDLFWYRFVWVDEDGGESPATTPAANINGTIPAPLTAPVAAAELAAIVQVNAASNADALQRCLDAAYGDIVSETGRSDFAGWELSLVEQVTLAHAEELWKQMKAPFGLYTIDAELGVGNRIARDLFQRHAHALAPLKREWGIA
jgi:hypothetical protein